VLKGHKFRMLDMAFRGNLVQIPADYRGKEDAAIVVVMKCPVFGELRVSRRLAEVE